MSEALSGIGNFLSKDVISPLGKIFGAGGGGGGGSSGGGSPLGAILSGVNVGMGEIGNLLAGRQQQQLYNQINAPLKAFQALTPAQLTAKIQSAEAPESQAEFQNIGNQVQADMASRGLAQAPGLFASAEVQALAPWEQQRYQTALQQVMQQYQIPLQYQYMLSQLLPKGQPMTPAIQLLLQQLGKLNAGGGTSITGGSTMPGGITTGPNPPDSWTPPTFPSSDDTGPLTPGWNPQI